MSTVETIQHIVVQEGHDCSVGFNPDGRVVCNIDGQPYSPMDAANKFILGGWESVWRD